MLSLVLRVVLLVVRVPTGVLSRRPGRGDTSPGPAAAATDFSSAATTLDARHRLRRNGGVGWGAPAPALKKRVCGVPRRKWPAAAATINTAATDTAATAPAAVV